MGCQKVASFTALLAISTIPNKKYGDETPHIFGTNDPIKPQCPSNKASKHLQGFARSHVGLIRAPTSLK